MCNNAARAFLAAVLLAGVWLPSTARGDDGAQDPRAKDALALLDSEDAYQRQVGFLRLEALRDPRTIEVIRAHVASTDAEHRAQAVRALAAIQGAPAALQLLEILGSDKQPNVRRAALLGLEPLTVATPELLPQVLPAMIASLRDRKPVVRMTAVDIVSRIDDDRARTAIRERYRRERDPNVRRVLDLAIKRLGDGS